MHFVKHDQYGNITQWGSCQDQDAVHLGPYLELLCVDGSRFYVKDGALVQYTNEQATQKSYMKPDGHAHWDNSTMSWINEL
jgi:hypothetical protein